MLLFFQLSYIHIVISSIALFHFTHVVTKWEIIFIFFRKAELYLNQGNLSEADDILKKLLDECESKDVSPHFYVR